METFLRAVIGLDVNLTTKNLNIIITATSEQRTD